MRYYRYISISFKIHPAPHTFFYHVFTAISDEHKFSLLQSHLASVMYFVFKIQQRSTASKFMFSSCHLMALLLTLSPMISIADLRRGVEQFSSCVYIMSLDLCVCVCRHVARQCKKESGDRNQPVKKVAQNWQFGHQPL